MAWTERYVRADADGTGDGTTDANTGATGAWTIAQALTVTTGAQPGHRVNVKAGAYSGSSGLATSTAGTTTQPIWWRGFKATIGDMDTASHGTFMSGTDVPAFDMSTERFQVNHGFNILSNLDIRGSRTANSQLRLNGTAVTALRCRIECTGSASAARAVDNLGFDSQIIRCWVKATATADRVINIGGRHYLAYSTITGGVEGVNLVSNTDVVSCIFRSQASYAMSGGGNVAGLVSGNIIHDTGSDAVRITGTHLTIVFKENIFSEIGGIAINNATGTDTALIIRHRNAFYSITTGQEAGFGDTEAIEPITLTASPFVNAAAGDFNINDTTGGGALLRAATVVMP